jgi:ElaA protein
MNCRIEIVSFTELTTTQLYQLLQLRNEVFILEQTCYYQDIDDKDMDSHHLLLYTTEGLMVGYCRLLPTGLSYPNYCSIGRVLVKKDFRNYYFGVTLMNEAIAFCKAKYATAIKIGAQKYLEKWYNNLGFFTCGEEYLEDDIPHLPMKLQY